MEKSLSALVLTPIIVVVSALPLPVHAYLSPEQVFGGQTQDLRPAPMTQREGEAAVAERQQRTEDWRTEEQKSLTSIDDEPEDTYVPSTTSDRPNLLDENARYDLRMERMEEADAKGGPTTVVAGNGTVVDSKGNVLHSGAPLVTATGPETAIALLVMILAAACTFGYVLIVARRFRPA